MFSKHIQNTINIFIVRFQYFKPCTQWFCQDTHWNTPVLHTLFNVHPNRWIRQNLLVSGLFQSQSFFSRRFSHRQIVCCTLCGFGGLSILGLPFPRFHSRVSNWLRNFWFFLIPIWACCSYDNLHSIFLRHTFSFQIQTVILSLKINSHSVFSVSSFFFNQKSDKKLKNEGKVITSSLLFPHFSRTDIVCRSCMFSCLRQTHCCRHDLCSLSMCMFRKEDFPLVFPPIQKKAPKCLTYCFPPEGDTLILRPRGIFTPQCSLGPVHLRAFFPSPDPHLQGVMVWVQAWYRQATLNSFPDEI